MIKSALITGGYGFLGRAVAHHLKSLGFRVVGIGHSQWPEEQAHSAGFDVWLDASISLSSLMTLDEDFDLIVHCGGKSSVGYSIKNPLQDFTFSVLGTAELLEYIRQNDSKAMLIFPSSAGVYGVKDDEPIDEKSRLNPISPYGYHKMITEDLLAMHSKLYNVKIAIIRFFSLYGPGLQKQLLWDASVKLINADREAVFWGTGDETRDWIYIEDAVELISLMSGSLEQFSLVNGASGKRVTVRSIIELLRDALNVDIEIKFNGEVRSGDPRFYHADISRISERGKSVFVPLEIGINNYAEWFKKTWSK